MKKTIEHNGKVYHSVEVAGKLYVQDKVYFAVQPEPVAKDSWQNDNEKRFLAIPGEPIEYNHEGKPLYSFARHVIISGDYLLDLCCLTEIYCWGRLDETEPDHKQIATLFDEALLPVNDDLIDFETGYLKF